MIEVKNERVRAEVLNYTPVSSKKNLLQEAQEAGVNPFLCVLIAIMENLEVQKGAMHAHLSGIVALKERCDAQQAVIDAHEKDLAEASAAVKKAKETNAPLVDKLACIAEEQSRIDILMADRRGLAAMHNKVSATWGQSVDPVQKMQTQDLQIGGSLIEANIKSNKTRKV